MIAGISGQPFGPFKFRGAHEPFGLALDWRRFLDYFRPSGPMDPSVGDDLRDYYNNLWDGRVSNLICIGRNPTTYLLGY